MVVKELEKGLLKGAQQTRRKKFYPLKNYAGIVNFFVLGQCLDKFNKNYENLQTRKVLKNSYNKDKSVYKKFQTQKNQ